MSSDADVMRYYPAPWSREQSDAFAQRVLRLIDELGWGFWAVEERVSGRFIGFVGLHVPSDKLPFSPCVEVGWRLAKPYWGLGYATEAAQSAIAFGFQQKGVFLAEIRREYEKKETGVASRQKHRKPESFHALKISKIPLYKRFQTELHSRYSLID